MRAGLARLSVTQRGGMTMDLALTEGRNGEAIAHRADCERPARAGTLQVRALAAAGQPVMTMLGCEKPLPDDVPRHSCLEPDQPDLFDRAGAT